MLQLDLSKRAARMIEQGRVTMTFRSPSGSHITLTAKCRGKNDAGKWIATNLADAMLIFIEVPNEGGWNDKVGKVTRRGGFTPDAHADDARAFCARQMLSYLTGGPTAAGLEIFEEDRCGACGRQLTDPISIERGIGPECYGRITGSTHEPKVADSEAATAATKHESLDAALEAVGTGIEETGDLTDPRNHMRNETGDDADWGGITEAHFTQSRSQSDGRDDHNVPYVGDWRARADYAEQVREPVKLAKEYSQVTELPGETWGDIFREKATDMGLTLPEGA